ncbi:ATP synthase F1 subunit gamma [Coprobacter tertius]|uniref:ATP synthase gamma chain n=1 Tax=Coprobacter tertius TaxID=2944915 RepID=A0ABT1MFX0_9BACT|nr:ATP synthase F1 subunit gamma [Coprobacter tertius]MCP9611532.1 ATP synthase F1 subunit gamma [Coprobacter tertius]
MATMRELKGRIGSVNSSQKITGAMKMISSAKLRKAEQALRHVLPFRDQLQNTINNLLGADSDYQSPLTEQRPVQRVALVVFGSDEGLCGAFNVELIKKMNETIDRLVDELGYRPMFTVYPVGKKVYGFVSKMQGIELGDARYLNSKSGAEAVKRMSDELTARFLDHIYDKVVLVYDHYKSVGTQILSTRVLLPIEMNRLGTGVQGKNCGPYIYEPDSETIFKVVLPLYVRSTLQETWAESRTSEQAARIMAMQMANDNANKLLDSLQLEYNKLRQQSITAELLDILGGTVQQ